MQRLADIALRASAVLELALKMKSREIRPMVVPKELNA